MFLLKREREKRGLWYWGNSGKPARSRPDAKDEL